MPELPEVETTRVGISPHIEGQTLQHLVVRDARLRWPVPSDLASKVVGKHLKHVIRRGKYLLFEFDHGAIIGHLGMTGSMRMVAHDEPPAYHDHVDLVFSDLTLRYRDPRRFGCILWHDNPVMAHPLLASLGPEPLSDAFHTAHLVSVCKGKKQAIKSLIMDSKKVVGVGNIYANEALFMAGINPKRQAGRISKIRMEKLVASIKKILLQAIDAGGTTLQDFHTSDGGDGYFKAKLNAYDRKGKPCLFCSSAISMIVIGQRSTFYCKNCQT